MKKPRAGPPGSRGRSSGFRRDGRLDRFPGNRRLRRSWKPEDCLGGSAARESFRGLVHLERLELVLVVGERVIGRGGGAPQAYERAVVGFSGSSLFVVKPEVDVLRPGHPDPRLPPAVGVVRDAAEARRSAREPLALPANRHDELLESDALHEGVELGVLAGGKVELHLARTLGALAPVSYTHLTLPTKRIV